MQGKGRATCDMKTKENYTLKIMYNAFNDSSTCICKSMHILTDFINNKKIFGLVKVRYWRAPIIFQNYTGSENKQSDTLATFDVEIGVSIGL